MFYFGVQSHTSCKMSRLCCSWGATALRVGDAVKCTSIFCPNCTPSTSLASPCLFHKRGAFLLWRSMRKWKQHTTRRRPTKGINMIGECIHVMTTGAWVVRQPLPPCIVPFSFAFFFRCTLGCICSSLKISIFNLSNPCWRDTSQYNLRGHTLRDTDESLQLQEGASAPTAGHILIPLRCTSTLVRN